MPDTTPNKGLPFPEDTDPTDVPGDIEALAMALDGWDAGDIPFTPTGQLSSTNVQSALAELGDVEKGATQHVFTANGSLAAATVSGAKKLLIEVWGGGGGGGGVPATAAVQSTAGGGGGGGGYARALVSATQTYPLQVNVGAGGAGNSNAAGSVGGTSSVIANNGGGTTLASASGGGGGAVGIASGTAIAWTTAVVSAGAGTVGDVVSTGQLGSGGWRSADFPFAGKGGDAAGGGGAGGIQPTGASVGWGGAAPGGGGGGAASRNGAGAAAGGAGGAGRVVITAIY